MTAKGMGFFWGDENILKLIVVMAAQPCEYTKTTESWTFKWGELYNLWITSQ